MPPQYDRRTFMKHLAGVTGGCLAVQLLAGCAPNSTSSAAPTPAGARPAAPTAARASATIRYAFGNVNPQHWVALIGTERPDLPGAFGIAFDLVTTTNAPNALSALIGGSVEVAVVTPDSAWSAQNKTPDLKQLFAVGNGTPGRLIAQPEINGAADLKGMTLGASAVRGGPDTTALRLLLLENGLKDGDYSIVQAGGVADRTAAMRARAIQAVYQVEPQATLLRDAGFREIDNGNNYPSLKNIHGLILVSRPSWYQANPDLAINFIRAWDAITSWLYDPTNKQEVIDITKKTMEVADGPAQNAYELHIGQKVPAQDLHISEAFMQQFIQNQRRIGESVEELPLDPMRYVDATLLDRALHA